ncbi:hypothetical protein FVEG_08884 [Fusarium verticillioides 7600]|uniref:CFEM domain-containing protein n=1 Tax=Gibberella moniliformis (strain M3125 / FGSC 7600) TaxID=334819 RepID=W7MND4_GIBM7|nr:hypothetical protein FVEG_08884 [Fusarium verticillioides 7600]EWG49319.1 hypothetical protein FVEG_08884 [Fusarium verticillioides 7600]
MKSFFLFTTALLSSSVLAQSTSQAGGRGGGGGVLPECAQQCALKAIKDSKCGSEDPSCVCKAPGFTESYVSCVGSSCGPREAAAAISAGIRLCEAAGVTITAVPSATAESKSKGHGPTSAAPVVPAPPVVPTVPPVVTPTAPAPLPATPVPTAGANSLNTGVAAIGMAWASMMFLFALM